MEETLGEYLRREETNAYLQDALADFNDDQEEKFQDDLDDVKDFANKKTEDLEEQLTQLEKQLKAKLQS